jgi:DNA-binding Lrp family transcriptional regulator
MPDPEEIKKRILDALDKDKPKSMIELARKTRLNPMTISKYAALLEAEGKATSIKQGTKKMVVRK